MPSHFSNTHNYFDAISSILHSFMKDIAIFFVEMTREMFANTLSKLPNILSIFSEFPQFRGLNH